MTEQLPPASDPSEVPSREAPLEWLADELDRLRSCSTCIDHVAIAPEYDEGAMARAIHCLRIGMPRHFIDEAKDIFPLVRMRARPDDDIERVLSVLTGNHEVLSVQMRQTLARLDAFKLVEQPPSNDAGLSAELTAIADRERQHLALMRAIVLPIARLRLHPDDLESLRQDLLSRRSHH